MKNSYFFDFDKEYFQTQSYANVDFKKKFTMYWWSIRFYSMLIKKFKNGGRLLDVGCGLGHLLGRFGGNYETYGVDINRWAINRAKKNAPRSKLKVLPAERIDEFGKDFFDTVIARHLLEHLPQPQKVIQKISLSLKKGGIFLFATPNPENILYHRKKENWFGWRDKTHISIKTPKEW